MGTGERKHTEAQVVAHVAGSREEALAELERRARSYSPPHPLSPRRRRLLRVGDGFLLVVDGAWQSFVTRFTVAELLTDSAAPRAPEPEPEPRPEPAPEAEAAPEPVAAAAPTAPADARGPELDADGVPVRPAWLGRRDLP
ncbi:hypothetical protein HCU77_10990 [Streptomyces coelicolor]|nr:hypothetical protein [Streptomyces sp. SID7813]NSL79570.1 hypothetical protein [Streptomyces coelicolor]QKN71139.1 hypothetical protein HCU77_10990 [Streptomyces coelicolor]BDD71765.1 hypothetical protein JCM4020_23850 [Streptomyces coelicolor]GHA35400.1 hypothetical protein GCM10010391_18960 [Streptomyces anthocyanicus]